MTVRLRLVCGAGVFVLAVMGLAVGYWLWSANQPVQNQTQRFVIEPGDGASKVARNLVKDKIIAEPYSFILWSYQRGYNASLKTGEYRIEPDTTLLRLLEKFVNGEVISYSITFVEGWTFKEYLAELGRHEKINPTLTDASSDQIMVQLGHPELHPEGRFFPDTYVFSTNTPDIDILRQAFDRMKMELGKAWAGRDTDIMLKNSDQALILASIVEKETGKAEERETISAVFHNRLRKNMRLQTDPTVIYGLGDEFSGNLKRIHLKQDTPYNTYTRFGLPPTPIANPGSAAIHAALHPVETKALYFVARGDGSHQFSKTLKDHNQAVIKYQLGGKKKSFSSYNDNE